jgi:hypothetical protein
VNEPSTKFNAEVVTSFQIEIGTYLLNNYQVNDGNTIHNVSTPVMVKTLETTYGSIRSSILRMKNILCFTSVSFKKHQRDFTLSEGFLYFIDAMRKASTVNEVSTNRERSVTEASTHPSTSAASSSSNIKNTITTSDEKIAASQNEDWAHNIQTPENLKTLGLGLNHLKQLKSNFNFTSEEIQSNLEAFAYDLANGELERLKARGIQNIIGFFFGAMKKGGYNPVTQGFVTAEELAETEMIERLENKKRATAERKAKLQELLFEEWLETKSKIELSDLEKPVAGFMGLIHRAALKENFIKNEMSEFQKGI